jgi:hypothetical protein
MFWDSYAVTGTTDADPSPISDDAMWSDCRFVFRNRRTGDVVTTAFCGGKPPFIRDGRVLVRSLHLEASTPMERFCLRIVSLLAPRPVMRAVQQAVATFPRKRGM